MADQEWNDAELRTLAVGLGGTASSPDMLLLLNPTESECEFQLPSFKGSSGWDVVVDTAHPVGLLSGFRLPDGPVKVGPYQTLALQRVH
jgi:hypothetical protein